MGTYVPERYGGPPGIVSNVPDHRGDHRACVDRGGALHAYRSPSTHPASETSQKEKYVPKLARGESLGCFALSERRRAAICRGDAHDARGATATPGS